MKPAASLRVAFAGLLLLCAGLCAHAEGYPDKAVRVIVPFPPGGGSDIVARLLGQRLSELWKVPVMIDNKPGADTQIGTSLLARAAPDGYTLGVISPSFATSKALYANLPYDVVKDFTPVGMVASTPVLVAVNSEVPAATVKELADLSRRKAGKLNYSVSSTTTLLFGELFRAAAGVDAQAVPYKGSGPSVTATAAGETAFTVDTYGVMKPLADARRIRLIAVASKERFFPVPDVPTLDELGIPDVALDSYWGVIAPAGVPPAVVARLGASLKEVLAMPDVQQQLKSAGNVAAYSTSEDFGRFLAAEFVRYERIAKARGIKPVN
ncbi:tripartite tricarboxylate transporter substrate binding protein [Ramlibacter sp. G-1-2-2]|uniref:Tripartite tricarboxylate transporter substrate binding protein n=1 Tax=Ramlibacter agri TaxID=2728837 RepID=A0A848H6Y0_9BURK|nr:tripartite tricarboxylate transporter substrate binding protein [Ramlibacter agri]NML46736.1 tripartite tricarboxylate transporter substrate binding protein [Ramlibacter agri]